MINIYVNKCKGDKLDHSFDISKDDLVKLIKVVSPTREKELELCHNGEDLNLLHQNIIKDISSYKILSFFNYNVFEHRLSPASLRRPARPTSIAQHNNNNHRQHCRNN